MAASILRDRRRPWETIVTVVGRTFSSLAIFANEVPRTLSCILTISCWRLASITCILS